MGYRHSIDLSPFSRVSSDDSSISLIMLAGTTMLVGYGPWAEIEAVLLIMLGGVRIWFALGFPRRYDRFGEKAVSQFSMLTALQSLTLGFLSQSI